MKKWRDLCNRLHFISDNTFKFQFQAVVFGVRNDIQRLCSDQSGSEQIQSVSHFSFHFSLSISLTWFDLIQLNSLQFLFNPSMDQVMKHCESTLTVNGLQVLSHIHTHIRTLVAEACSTIAQPFTHVLAHRGLMSCSRTLGHGDCRGLGSNHLPTRMSYCWLKRQHG